MVPDPYIIVEDFAPVILTISPEHPTVATADAYLRKISEIYARKQPLMWINYMPKNFKNDRDANARIGKFMKETRETAKELTHGVVFLTSSHIFRFVLSGWFLFQTPEYPYRVVTQTEDALSFLETCKPQGMQFHEALCARSIEQAIASLSP